MSDNTSSSLLALSFAGGCPACGSTSVFAGMGIAFKDSCDNCGLDLSGHDNGDGPATAVMLVVGLVVMLTSVWLELSYAPSIWVHMAVATVLTLLTSWWSLRFFKAMLMVLQYRYRKKEMMDE